MFHEVMKLRGDLTIKLLALDGSEIKRFEQKNLIVDVGKQMALHRIGGDPAYDAEHIVGVMFGTTSATPAPGDTQRTVPPWTVEKATTNTYPAFNQLLATAVLGAAEQSGMVIAELGLVSGTHLFSRIVLNETINKTVNFSVRVEWLISIQ